MSEADFEVLRGGYEAFNRRDLDAMLVFFDPDAVWIPTASAWGAGNAYHGHEGVAELFADLANDWVEFEAEPREYRQAGDLIVVLGEVRATPKGGGAPVKSATAWIWEMRAGKALRLQAYTDPRRALEALGLTE